MEEAEKLLVKKDFATEKSLRFLIADLIGVIFKTF